jgi:hypothetical protein
MKMYKNILVFLFLLVIALPSQAQQIEMGFSLGGSNYTGDIANFKLTNFRPAGDVFFRYNLSPVSSFRVGLMGTRLHASDFDSQDPFQLKRGVEFNADVIEASLRYEYNFRDFRGRGEMLRMSPFVFVGAGAGIIDVNGNYRDDTAKGIQLSIPFGIGLKYAMAYNWNLGFEFGTRKTFTDNIDSIVNEENVGKFQRSNPNNKDLYYFLGISLSYTFEGVLCPIVIKR